MLFLLLMIFLLLLLFLYCFTIIYCRFIVYLLLSLWLSLLLSLYFQLTVITNLSYCSRVFYDLALVFVVWLLFLLICNTPYGDFHVIENVSKIFNNVRIYWLLLIVNMAIEKTRLKAWASLMEQVYLVLESKCSMVILTLALICFYLYKSIYQLLYKCKFASICKHLWVNLTLSCLTHSFPIHPFSTPPHNPKPYGFLMFSGGRERVHWEQMG